MELIVVLMTVVGLSLWDRAETRSDIRHLEEKIDNLITAILPKTKDFYAGLNVLEEKNKDRA